MILFIALFVLALMGIVTLFVLKHREVTTGRILAPRARARLDSHAYHLKDLLAAAESDLSKIIPELALLGSKLVHILALAAARAMRFFEGQLHRVADLVSHKHRFERPAPRSEFLTKIAEHKNGEGKREDTGALELDLRDK